MQSRYGINYYSRVEGESERLLYPFPKVATNVESIVFPRTQLSEQGLALFAPTPRLIAALSHLLVVLGRANCADVQKP
jgi:hypothetical protein